MKYSDYLNTLTDYQKTIDELNQKIATLDVKIKTKEKELDELSLMKNFYQYQKNRRVSYESTLKRRSSVLNTLFLLGSIIVTLGAILGRIVPLSEIVSLGFITLSGLANVPTYLSALGLGLMVSPLVVSFVQHSETEKMKSFLKENSLLTIDHERDKVVQERNNKMLPLRLLKEEKEKLVEQKNQVQQQKSNLTLIFTQSLENYCTEFNPDIPITTKTLPKTYIK